jgi:acetyl esterase
MPIDPQIEHFLIQFYITCYKPVQEWVIEEIRQLVQDEINPKIETVDVVQNLEIPGPAGQILIRIYGPDSSKALPAVIYYHGGGWVTGSLDTGEIICRALAGKTGYRVISVAYRLAPEHPFPAALEDAYAALKWVYEHAKEIKVNPTRIAVCGESSGGNLAAAVCLMARDRKGPSIKFQALLYPVLDANFETVSYNEYAQGYILEKENMMWFWDQYVSNIKERNNPYVAPLRETNFYGLPPALVITAECDPLCSEAEAYASKLRDSKIPVLYQKFAGMVHGFLKWYGVVDKATMAMIFLSAMLKRVLM